MIDQNQELLNEYFNTVLNEAEIDSPIYLYIDGKVTTRNIFWIYSRIMEKLPKLSKRDLTMRSGKNIIELFNKLFKTDWKFLTYKQYSQIQKNPKFGEELFKSSGAIVDQIPQ